MESKWLEKLEFNKVVHQLKKFATTEVGEKLVIDLEPQTDFNWVQTSLQETKEILDVLRLKGNLPLEKISDVTPHLQRLAIGASLNGKEIAQIGQLLKVTSYMVKYFEQIEEEQKNLQKIVDRLQVLASLSGKINAQVTATGEVKSSASETLQVIRRQIQSKEQRIKETLEQILRKKVKYLSDAVITSRNDRYVIPVKQEYRSQVPGIVHDQSSSGQTLFVEPQESVVLNNELQHLQNSEKAEIKRILIELSKEIEPYQEEIEINLRNIALLDFIQAKGLYANSIKAVVPNVYKRQAFRFRQARHPLLKLEQAVANDLELGYTYQTLVVTGPNTGGKTITLKTVGLLQLMGQAGLALPVAEESELGIFDAIMADIGDEQSIEQNLSTFSSHMKTIIEIMRQATSQSLVLFDELGAGTDPKEGAALAMAILDVLQARDARIIATTHYPELKWYGDDREKTCNASMEFDNQTLKPTYRLLVGVPGRSNAFEIAKRLGLEADVLTIAQSFMDSEDQSLNTMITDLEEQRQDLVRDREMLSEQIAESEQLHQDLTEAYQQLKANREKIIANAQREANKLIDKSQKEANKIITELKTKQANLEKQAIKEHELIEARTKLNALEFEEQTKLSKNKVLQKVKHQKQLKVGMDVLVIPYGQRGSIIGQRADKWEVQLGVLKMLFVSEDLEVVEQQPVNKATTVKRSSSKGISTTLDLRGMRYEEAMYEADKYIDQAILAGYAMVTIIHGKGTGALRQGIWQHLKNNKAVDHFEYADANAGGNGATVVYFK